MILITLADLAELSNAPLSHALLEKIKTLTQVTDAIQFEVVSVIQVFYGLNFTHRVITVNEEKRVYCSNDIVHTVDNILLEMVGVQDEPCPDCFPQ